MKIEKKLSAKNIFAIAATLIMFLFFFVTPFQGLEKTGMKFLGIFIWWIVMMMTDIMPSYLSSLIAVVISIISGVTNLGTAFSAFSGTTIWLMIGAFGLAGGLSASGLMTRIALNVMKLFPGTYVGQLSAVTASSVLLAPILPDANAKVAILLPVVDQISDQMGYEPHSKGYTGLSSMAIMIGQFLGRVFFTGSVDPALCLSLVAGLSLGWMAWLKFTWVFGLCLLVLLFIIHLIYFNPERGKGKAERSAIGKEVIEARLKELGKMSWQETLSLVIMIITILLWITEKSHGIPAAVVAVSAWCAFMLINLFKPQDIFTKITWPVIIFAGAIIGMSACISTSGLGVWIAQLVSPIVAPLADKPFLILLVISLLCHLLKFASVNFLVTSALFTSILSGVGSIHPLCIVFACLLGSSTFIMEYQSPAIVASLAFTRGRVTLKDMGAFPWIYIVASLVALAVTIPYWSLIGYIG